MGRVKFYCAYCDCSFEDSQDTRKRHFKGRNHRTNVKLWYDSFADQEKKRASAQGAAGSNIEWTPVSAKGYALPPQSITVWHTDPLPPSMLPAPPEAFRHPHRLAEWG